MNIIFLIKGVSIWIELSLIFFHVSSVSAVVKPQPYFLFLTPIPSFPGLPPQLPLPPKLPTLQSQSEPSRRHPLNELSSPVRSKAQPLSTPNNLQSLPPLSSAGNLRPSTHSHSYHDLPSNPVSLPLPSAHLIPPSRELIIPSPPVLSYSASTNKNPFVTGSPSNIKQTDHFQYGPHFTTSKELSFPEPNPPANPHSYQPHDHINTANPIVIHISNMPLLPTGDNSQPYNFPNLLSHVLSDPPASSFRTSTTRRPKPPYLYIPFEPEETPYVMAGNATSTNQPEIIICDLECRGRGYRTYKNILPDKCKCINSTQLLKALDFKFNCDADCEPRCIKGLGQGGGGQCDSKGFCYCYDQKNTLEISGTCVVPAKVCDQKCGKLGYNQSSCMKDRCNCANGTQIISFDYLKTGCNVPREYCRRRCALTPPFLGHCLYDQCICSLSTNKIEKYFVLDLFPDDSKCEACVTRCKAEKFKVGRCIAGECLCHTDNKFKVIKEANTNAACQLPRDFCLVHCAQLGLHYQAICRNNFTCFCGGDGRTKKANMLQDPCIPSRKSISDDCIQREYLMGLCSDRDFVCFGVDPQTLEMLNNG